MSDDTQPPGQQVRRLVRTAERAGLATLLAQDEAQAPYVSLVLAASDYPGNPLLLLSDLADHPKNLAAAPRVALLFAGTAASNRMRHAISANQRWRRLADCVNCGA